MFGVAKGALGTLLDGRGTAFDQAELMVALLRAAGLSPKVEVGDISFSAAQLSTWLDASVAGSGIEAILQVGGFPCPTTATPCQTLVTYSNSNVTGARLRWAWVRLEMDGGSFVFNPALKSGYDVVAGVVGTLPAMMGYNQSTFLSRALTGADTSQNWRIANLNRANIRGDLASFAASLRTQLQAQHPNAGPIDILGGTRVQPLALNTRLRQATIPGVVPNTTVTYDSGDFPDALVARLTVVVPGAAPVTLRSSQVYGRRLSLFFNMALEPVLRLDGQVLATGAAQPDRQPTGVGITLSYPGGIGDGSGSAFVTAGANAAYVIVANWAGSGRAMIERQRRILQENRLADPGNDAVEPVLGQSLVVLGANWFAASSRSQQLSDRIVGTSALLRHVAGIAGMTVPNAPPAPQITGPYLDLPVGVTSIIETRNRAFGSGFTPLEQTALYTHASIDSVHESGVIAQTLPGQVAVSTVMLLDTWSQSGPIVDINNSSVAGNNQSFYSSTIRPTLTNYVASNLANIDNFVNPPAPPPPGNSDPYLGCRPSGCRVIAPSTLPAPPVGPGIVVNNWRGIGYYVLGQGLSISSLISNQSSGGSSTTNITPAQVNSNLAASAQPQSLSSTNTTPGVASSPSVGLLDSIGDPLNRVTGDYVYSHDDLAVGTGAFPYSLGFQRLYDSSRSTRPVGPLGRAWTHNFDVYVQPDSDGFEGMAATSPRAGAAAIVAILVINDILNAPTPNDKPLDRMVIGAIATRWLMDQLTGNVVRVIQPKATQSFVRILGDTFAATGELLAPVGSSTTLTRNANGTYTLATGDGTAMQFGAADLTTPGRISSWSNAGGAQANFAYSGNLLTTVSNSFGRTLQLSYTGDRLTSVLDGNGRSVGIGYDANGRHTSMTDPLGAVTRFEYDGASERLTRIFFPSNPAAAFISNTYDALGRVTVQGDAAGNLTQAFFAGRRTELLEPSGNRHVWYFDTFGMPIAEVQDFGRNPDGSLRLNLVTRTAYDGQLRPVSVTLPEGNRTETTYDGLSNPLTITRFPKPGSSLTPLTQTFTYSGPLANRANFRRIATATDPRGNTTTYGYDSATGNLLTITQPEVERETHANPVNPITTFTWTNRGLPVTETDAEGRVTTYEYDGAGNRTATIVDSGTGRLNLRTTYTYDAVGNIRSIVSPRGNAAGATPADFTVSQAFDAKRRLTQTYQRTTESNAVYTYDADDRPTGTQRLAWATGTPRPTLLTSALTYTPTGQPSVATDPDGNTITYAYDGADRLLSVTRSSGRRTNYGYDILSRLVTVTDDVSGTLDPSITRNRGSVTRETRSYTANSQLATLTDGNSNPTSYTYDGFDRLAQTTYADTRAEAYQYDANGNRTQRTTRANEAITFSYDALNRLTTRAVPSNANAVAVTYTHGYDLVGRMLRRRQSTDANSAIYAYDTAGRLVQETRPDGRVIGYVLDPDGSPVRLTWPEGGAQAYQAAWTYDVLGRVTGAYEGIDSTGLRLGSYSYDTASRRVSLSYGNNASTIWDWRPSGQVQSLRHGFVGGAGVTFTYLYNRENALSARLVSDATWQAATSNPALQLGSQVYVRNTVNQYVSVVGTAFSYDLNGNLTGDGQATYRYDPQNRLVGVTRGSTVVSYAYDPEGRRASRTVGGTTTRFLYAMGQEIAEYEGAGIGSLVRRHVPGPGLDEPLATVTGDGAGRTRLWYHTDAQGSVLARSNAAGVVPAGERFAYTPYGVADSDTGATAFRYLGRRLEPTIGLYDMRARAYSPTLGRFMQMDPIGTEGGINLYAYAQNSPLNATDTSGLAAQQVGSSRWNLMGPTAAGVSGNANTIDEEIILMNSGGDRLIGSMGSARLNNAIELDAIIGDLRTRGVNISFREGQFAYGPAASGGRPGNIIFDPDGSISAIRHEYGHFLDDYALGFPGQRFYYENPGARVATERSQYLGEIRTARQLGDQSARRALIQDYLSERNYIIENFYTKPYGGR
jgi:RHS repeat-associated protein